MNKYILDDNGDPVPCTDVLEWARWFEAAGEKRQLARDELGEVLISTIFLGIDHSWSGGPPILWETMIFDGQGDEYQERAATKEEALENHYMAIQIAMERRA